MALAKGLQVERVVRVACPARGTLLASKRLDAYLSVLQWGLRTRRCAGRAAARRLPARGGAAPRRPHRAARHRGDDAREPGGRLAERRRGSLARSSCAWWPATWRATRSARGSRRCWPTPSTGPTTTSSCRRARCTAARRTRPRHGPGASFLLDRGAQGHALQLLRQRPHRERDRRRRCSMPPRPGSPPIGPLSWAGQDASGTRAAKAVARSRGRAPARTRPRPARRCSCCPASSART